MLKVQDLAGLYKKNRTLDQWNWKSMQVGVVEGPLQVQNNCLSITGIHIFWMYATSSCDCLSRGCIVVLERRGFRKCPYHIGIHRCSPQITCLSVQDINKFSGLHLLVNSTSVKVWAINYGPDNVHNCPWSNHSVFYLRDRSHGTIIMTPESRNNNTCSWNFVLSYKISCTWIMHWMWWIHKMLTFGQSMKVLTPNIYLVGQNPILPWSVSHQFTLFPSLRVPYPPSYVYIMVCPFYGFLNVVPNGLILFNVCFKCLPRLLPCVWVNVTALYC